MEKLHGKASMSKEETAIYMRKVRRAAQLLLFRAHRKPGIKGWELRRMLGKDYMKIIDLLQVEFDKLGLQIKILPMKVDKLVKKLSKDELAKARFFVTFKEPIRTLEATAGWRIDDIAMLAAIVAYITSKHGKARRREIEKLLSDKFPRWRIDMNIDRFIRQGYLGEERGTLYLDWRALVEIDQKSLLSLIVGITPRR
jgi:hypothetical protein